MLTIARSQRKARGLPLLDLTLSNPTLAGFDYPPQLIDTLTEGAHANYDPDPRGSASAREALASALSHDREGEVSPDDLILTASTSEAYSYLFKLLADPGDSILTPAPSYPLLDELVALEQLSLRHFPLSLENNGGTTRWNLERGALEECAEIGVRAVVVIHPNNPTGSYLRCDEQLRVADWCSTRDVALISDEVFYDYAFADDGRRAGPAATAQGPLSFSLGGLSKSAALPHWKLAWIEIGGPEQLKRQAARGLELIADSFLSVATPVQVALPRILELAPQMRGQIMARCRSNLAAAHRVVGRHPELQLLDVEGGWSLVLRVPQVVSDEALALAAMEREGIVVHPGYFFDFPSDGFLVVSLLAREAEFADGFERLVRVVVGVVGGE